MKKFTDSEIDFMEADLATDFAYSAIIEQVRTRMEAEGKDMYLEFQKWAEENGKTPY